MLHSALLIPLLAPLGVETVPVAGLYVEARTASVFAGACHYNSEFVTGGRDALCAWRIESGVFAGVDLSGVAIALVVTSDANLDEGGPRRSTIHVDSGSVDSGSVDSGQAPQRAAAAVRWLATTRAGLVGEVVGVHSTPLQVAFEGEAYSVLASGRFELAGRALPDRACCAMPQNVWYAPLDPLESRLVGLDETFAVEAPELGRAWSRPGENAAFVGRFGGRFGGR